MKKTLFFIQKVLKMYLYFCNYLEEFTANMNHPRFLHGLIKSILFHYFIVYIHPFFDGNGRTARTLSYFIGMQNNLKFLELLSISADLKQHGNKYETSFDLVQKYNLDLTYFILYRFLFGCSFECSQTS